MDPGDIREWQREAGTASRNIAPRTSAQEAARVRSRTKGGVNRRTPTAPRDGELETVSLRTAEEIVTELERVYAETRLQANSASRSKVLGALLQIALTARHTGGLEERLAAVEAQLTSVTRPRLA